MAAPALKTQVTDASVADFLAQLDDERRRQDCQQITSLMQEITGAEPRMWGSAMIGFGKYKYQYASGHEGEWFVAGFAPRKNQLTLYLISSIDSFPEQLTRLGKHKVSGSCLHIKTLADVDMAVLRELITETVARLAPKRTE